jgi:hypothetical protein
MPEVMFFGPKLKLERAAYHIQEMEAVLRAYVSRDPYRLVGEIHAETKLRRIVFRVREPLPPGIPTVVGDAIHNLRSALDIMLCDMAALEGDHSRKARFPFWRDPSGEKKALERIATLGPRGKRIVHAIKRNKGIDDTLRSLHDLDVRDKHQLILVTQELVTLTIYRRGEQISVYNRPRLLKDGEVIETFRLGHDSEIHDEPRGSFDIAFGEGQPCANQPIGKVLAEFEGIIRQLIAFAEREFTGGAEAPSLGRGPS